MKNYKDIETETLVTLTLAGDQGAYEALVLRFQRAVIASAARITGSEYMAEDAAQDAFVSAWLKLASLRERGKFGAWVCRIAKNCAKNMVIRYRDYINIDAVIGAEYETGECTEDAFLRSSETEDLHESIDTLPEKVKTVIKLHYFEGYSLAEIAAMTRAPVGTVKYQLHEGRRMIRKELCAMNENMNDTLVERVMKKVEEIKLWRLRDNKEGFADVYNETLAEVENLPESREKQGMLADVLLRGWWWVPGAKNDELFARIKAATIESLNEDVMAFVANRERDKLSGKAKREFTLNTQIPELEKLGFIKARAYCWFWLGYEYFRADKYTEGYEAMENVLSLLTPKDMYYANALAAIAGQKAVENEENAMYNMHALANVYRFVGSKCHLWAQPGYGNGGAIDGYWPSYVFNNFAWCDDLLFDNAMKPGDVYTGSDGVSTVTFETDCDTVATPCGVFESCERWGLNSIYDHNGKQTCKCTVWFKNGVGCVKADIGDRWERKGGVAVLKAYEINGGSGKMPFAAGNRWEYETELDSNVFEYKNVVEVTAADKTEATLSQYWYCIRKGYDETSFEEMMKAARRGYCKPSADNDEEDLVDVSRYLEKAEKLAKTPLEKAHVGVASKVMKRIFETDEKYNPERTASGHWNFFTYEKIMRENGRVYADDDRVFSFEWKDMGNRGKTGNALLYNFIYDIFQAIAGGTLWNDAWKAGFEEKIKYKYIDQECESEISVSDAGTVTTEAGTFENCLCVSIKASGFTGGFAYRGGHKEYYFAPGVGMVKAVIHRYKYSIKNVFNLTAYRGTGEGYMPLRAGMFRRYEAEEIGEGYVASAEYTFENDENGELIMLANQEGIKKL
ncbi:MAG: sigma-70 family RNA polymerase sigma factor [Clostridia bacterium]|nr:sigma-70 family RNA polymerase sigma factor [Clostridia bacterium]